MNPIRSIAQTRATHTALKPSEPSRDLAELIGEICADLSAAADCAGHCRLAYLLDEVRKEAEVELYDIDVDPIMPDSVAVSRRSGVSLT